MANGKWFFPAQKTLSEFLEKKYVNTRCNWQELGKERVVECYTVWEKKNAIPMIIISTITKYGDKSAALHVYGLETLVSEIVD